MESIDHLCCGNLGRVDFLLMASQTLRRPALAEEARRQASVILRRGKQAGEYGLGPNVPTGVLSPSLFQGMAGIGFEFLRLVDPARVPSVLALD